MSLAFTAIVALAHTTIREAVRSRILYVLALFALGLILFSSVLSDLTLGYQIRIVTDVSLSAVSMTGTVIAILLGVGSVAREIEKRTYYPVLAKPVSRSAFVLGKWAGVVATTWLIAAIMFAFATVMIAYYTHEGRFQYGLEPYATTILLTMIRLAVIAAIAVSASTFAGTTVATMATVVVVIAGYFSFEARWFLQRSESPVSKAIGEAVYYALPDLAALDALPRLVHVDPLGLSDLLGPGAYAIGWATVLLSVACAFFSRRDLT